MYLADGTGLTINDGAANAATAVPGIITITPPSSEMGEYDATALDSTAGTMVKEPKSRTEPGTMSWTMFKTHAQYDRLCAHRDAGTKKSFVLTYPDTETDTWTGFIRKVDTVEAQNQEPVKLTVTVQVCGLVTRSAV